MPIPLAVLFILRLFAQNVFIQRYLPKADELFPTPKQLKIEKNLESQIDLILKCLYYLRLSMNGGIRNIS